MRGFKDRHEWSTRCTTDPKFVQVIRVPPSTADSRRPLAVTTPDSATDHRESTSCRSPWDRDLLWGFALEPLAGGRDSTACSVGNNSLAPASAFPFEDGSRGTRSRYCRPQPAWSLGHSRPSDSLLVWAAREPNHTPPEAAPSGRSTSIRYSETLGGEVFSSMGFPDQRPADCQRHPVRAVNGRPQFESV